MQTAKKNLMYFEGLRKSGRFSRAELTISVSENLNRYIIRISFSQQKMICRRETGQVEYQSKSGKEIMVFNALEGLNAINSYHYLMRIGGGSGQTHLNPNTRRTLHDGVHLFPTA